MATSSWSLELIQKKKLVETRAGKKENIGRIIGYHGLTLL